MCRKFSEIDEGICNQPFRTLYILRNEKNEANLNLPLWAWSAGGFHFRYTADEFNNKASICDGGSLGTAWTTTTNVNGINSQTKQNSNKGTQTKKAELKKFTVYFQFYSM